MIICAIFLHIQKLARIGSVGLLGEYVTCNHFCDFCTSPPTLFILDITNSKMIEPVAMYKGLYDAISCKEVLFWGLDYDQ